jgi:ribosome-binding factor A
MAEVKRAVRVAARVQEELAAILSQEARDPRLGGVVVSRVEMPDDLRSARVYFRLIGFRAGPSAGDQGGETRRREALAALVRASGMLRREVTARVGLKFAPDLRFYYDEAQEKIARIEELLEEVRREQKT